MNRTQKSTQTQGKGGMSVREAGRKGGEMTSRTHGPEFYQEIGHKGGQKVRELIRRGSEAMGGESTRSGRSR